MGRSATEKKSDLEKLLQINVCQPRDHLNINGIRQRLRAPCRCKVVTLHTDVSFTVSSIMTAVMDVLADVGFLYDKDAVLGETIKETSCIYLHKVTHIHLENLNDKKFGSVPYTGG